MKVLVAISHVPDTTTKIKFTPDKKNLDKTGVSFVINPYDEYALSYAVGLKEKKKAEKVVVICVGEKEVEPTLRKALAIGADEAVRINATPVDGFFTASQIAEYAKSQNFDLLLFGKESIDFNGAQVPSMVAEMLEIPVVYSTSKAEIEGNKATIEREISGGSETLEIELPVILVANKDLAKERIPNIRGIRMARKKPLNVVEPNSSSPKVETVMLEPLQSKRECKLIDPDNVEELVKVLAEKGAL